MRLLFLGNDLNFKLLKAHKKHCACQQYTTDSFVRYTVTQLAVATGYCTLNVMCCRCFAYRVGLICALVVLLAELGESFESRAFVVDFIALVAMFPGTLYFLQTFVTIFPRYSAIALVAVKARHYRETVFQRRLE